MAAEKYLANCKVECGKRLINHLFDPATGDMDRKHWTMFGKKLFLGQKFINKIYNV